MSVIEAIDTDRRNSDRLPTPVCPFCGTDEFVVGVIRTSSFVFFRCQSCRDRELMPKVIPAVVLSRDWLL